MLKAWIPTGSQKLSSDEPVQVSDHLSNSRYCKPYQRKCQVNNIDIAAKYEVFTQLKWLQRNFFEP